MGTLAELGQFSQGLAASPVTGYKPPFGEAVEAAKGAGLVLIGAHMYRCGKELARLREGELRRLDGLELKGKDFFNDGAVRAEAGRRGLPVIGGSEAGVWCQVGAESTG